MLIRKKNLPSSPSPPRAKLSPQQRLVLYWAMQGKTMDVTAQILGVCHGTVATHVRMAMWKLRADNTTHAVVRALVVGELKLEEVL